jgi:hypothetical protein
MRLRNGLLAILILFFYSSNSGHADVLDSTYLALEIGGSGGFGAINLGKSLHTFKKGKMNCRIGLSTFQLIDFERKLNPDLIVPLELETVFGKSHQLKMGIGTTIVAQVRANSVGEKMRNWHLNHFLKVGYRYKFKSKPYFIEFGYSPVLLKQKEYRNWAFLGLGKFLIK